MACISRTPHCYGELQAPIPLTPLAITCATRWTRQCRNNLSRLIVPPMYRSSELLQEPIDGLEPPTYRLQGDCTAIVLYRLVNMAQNRSLHHTRFISPPLFDYTKKLFTSKIMSDIISERQRWDSNPKTFRLPCFQDSLLITICIRWHIPL